MGSLCHFPGSVVRSSLLLMLRWSSGLKHRSEFTHTSCAVLAGAGSNPPLGDLMSTTVRIGIGRFARIDIQIISQLCSKILRLTDLHIKS